MEFTIEQYCAQKHPGQWFTFQQDGKTKEKSFDTLRLTEQGEQKGCSLPTKQDFEDWKAKQEAKQKEQEVIQNRREEYGSPGQQLERIIEAIAAGDTPTQALKAEAQRVKDIKQKYPKDV